MKGRVADGIDHRQISTHSGAEANIAGGLALVADPTVISLAMSWNGLGG